MKSDVEISADCYDRMMGTLTVTVNVKTRKFRMAMLRARMLTSGIKLGCRISGVNCEVDKDQTA